VQARCRGSQRPHQLLFLDAAVRSCSLFMRALVSRNWFLIEEGTKLGRKPLEETDAAKVAAIRAMRDKRTGIRRIARELGVGVGTVLRVTACA
jgi:hypothetical protein